MSNEAQIRSSLQITSGLLKYQSQPTDFRADVPSAKAATPGGFTASVEGTDVDLSELTTPGLCRIMNLDPDNFVTIGMWDGEFHPMLEALPGETYVMRLSRQLGFEYGVGTGTSGSGNTLRVKADTAPCEVIVEAFEKD